MSADEYHLQGFDLDGRQAVVTGAGRGIGEACAIALAQAGADVIAMSRTQEEIDHVAERIESGGGRARAAACDVTDADSVRQAFADLQRVDILVNSAGTNIPEPFLSVREKHLDAVMRVNVIGTFLASQVAVQHMIGRGEGGSIINVSSQMGHVGAARRTVYCASKPAGEGLTKAMAVELAEHRIRVNAIAPTYIETPMTKPFFEDPEFRRDAIGRIPLGRLGVVGDVVGAVVYLASPGASLVTGTSLVIDGGYTAQ